MPLTRIYNVIAQTAKVLRPPNTYWAMLREGATIVLWVYVLLKLLVFDVDLYVLAWLAPDLTFLPNLRLLGNLIVISALWLILGHRGILVFAIYVLLYPLIVLFWRIPKRAVRHWPLLIIFGPNLYVSSARLRATLLLYSLAALSATIILLADQPIILISAMLGLAIFLAIHLYRSVRKPSASVASSELVRQARQLRKEVEDKGFETELFSRQQGATASKEISSDLMGIYTIHSLAQHIADRVQTAMRHHVYDLYLTGSWLYTVGLSTFVYALLYFALHKMTPHAFLAAEEASFWSFLGFSISILTGGNISPISPLSQVAEVLCYSQLVWRVLIVVILVFMILTAAREGFQDDMRQFTSELHLLAQALERRVFTVYQLTLVQVAQAVTEGTPVIVNILRRLQGLPKLPVAKKQDTNAEDVEAPTHLISTSDSKSSSGSEPEDRQ